MKTNESPLNAIIISASSDIGLAMSRRWASHGWRVYGTYRTESKEVKSMRSAGMQMVHCDLSDVQSIESACSELRTQCPRWDVLVMAPGLQDPVGPFLETNFDEWESSVKVNFTSQMRITQRLMATRNASSERGPCVLYFAGGGSNNATVNYSAYTISKIALIKMCELLDAEIPDTRFVIMGPGWVKTKIHESTLKAGRMAGDNYQRTIQKLASKDLTPMEQVLGCCDYLVSAPHSVVGGRNFSTVFDRWGDLEFERQLAGDPNLLKLRRHGNDLPSLKRQK